MCPSASTDRRRTCHDSSRTYTTQKRIQAHEQTQDAPMYIPPSDLKPSYHQRSQCFTTMTSVRLSTTTRKLLFTSSKPSKCDSRSDLADLP